MVPRPKVGLIVDGVSEMHLHLLIRDWPDGPVLKPLRAQTDPKAKPQKQAAEIVKAMKSLLALKCSTMIVLFDLEDQECPGVKARQLQQAIESELRKQAVRTEAPWVNYKVRKLENWLVADFEGASKLVWLDFSAKAKAQIAAGADNIPDACKVLDGACQGGKCYSKEKLDSFKAIAPLLSTRVMAQRSPSFRRFLRILGWTVHLDQSQESAGD